MEQSRPLPEVLSDILTLQGAILEKKGDDCLEYLSPPHLSKTLGIPEHGVLSFTYHPSYGETISASYDSELFRAIERLFSGRGKIATATYPPHLPNIEKLSKLVTEKLVLANATFRLQKVEIQTISYVFSFFKYTATSDEKKEGLYSLLVNGVNLSTQPIVENLIEIMEGLKEPDSEVTRPKQEVIKPLLASFSASSLLVEEELGQFIKSLERRLNRDIRRVFEYYETLKFETQRAIERKAHFRENILEKEGRGGFKKGEATEKLSMKLDAIEAEKNWKIQDLISKYAMDVRIEPVSSIIIQTESPAFWINIKRRLSSRQFRLTYNPMLKKIDPLPCEKCFYPRGGYYICDEKLHIVCASCFKKCPECGRQYCSACHKNGCPKCSERKT